MSVNMCGYVLVRATEAQDLIATEREWVEWGQPLLTKEQFIMREQDVLGTTDFSKQRRQRWVLVPADDTTTLDFLCACETYRRPILLKLRAQDHVQSAMAYSICSVFVPPAKRRNGYAQKMMSLMQHQLNPRPKIPQLRATKLDQDLDQVFQPHEADRHRADATCSFLYSDVGEYYSKFGWQVVGNRHVEWKPLSKDEAYAPPAQRARWLSADQLKELGRIDRQYLLSQLEQRSDTHIRFCIDDPDATSWRWLIQRSQFYATTLLPASAPKPSYFGLILPSPTAEDSQPSYAVWMFDFVAHKLAVLRLRFTSAAAFEQLLGALRHQAAQFGMHKCVAWNVDLASLGVELNAQDHAQLERGESVERFHDELRGGAVVERSGNGASLPALSWYADRKPGDKLEWVCNEYGWWC